jgi:septum formation protein
LFSKAQPTHGKNVTEPHAPRLVLASTSRYRRQLLERLGLPFDAVPPEVDEARLPLEPPEQLCCRLARLKAEAAARRFPGAFVIGSDQVAVRDGQVLGKPGTADRCRQQLADASGRELAFLTAVHVVNGELWQDSHLDRTVVRFRRLGPVEIERYVARERPLDCAGGFKVESLGIALFDAVESRDPTALTGLPLIWLSGVLRRAGHAVP